MILTSYGRLHYLWKADLSERLLSIVSMFIFFQYFSIDFGQWKIVGLPHIACIVTH